jgi:hypothetical protein
VTSFSPAAPNPYTILDLSSVFAGQATHVSRGFKIVGEKSVLVQDEIAGLKAGSTVRWAMVTSADISVDGAAATLTDHGKQLHARLLSPAGATFAVLSAEPPKNSYDAANPGRRILVVNAPAGTDGNLRISVWLQPASARELTPPSVTSLTQWPE